MPFQPPATRKLWTKPLAAMLLLLGVMGTPLWLPSSDLPRVWGGEGNLELCRQWAASQGPQRAALADELGRRNALTKVRKLAEPNPSTGRSVYATADIRRLCRRH